MDKIKTALVWFKKDLRVSDHRPLFEATQHFDRVIGLYIYEKDWVNSYEFDPSHLVFLNECLSELKLNLKNKNITLLMMQGEAEIVFSKIIDQLDITHVFSHQETGNFWTFQRDLKLIHLFKSKNILFKEYYQNAVIRKLKSRDLWNDLRIKIIQRKLIPDIKDKSNLNYFNPETSKLFFHKDIQIENRFFYPQNSLFNVSYTSFKILPKGGEFEAQKVLFDFLNVRSKKYLQGISSPELSIDSSSRLSAYLSFGALSLTQIHHSLVKKVNQIEDSNLNIYEKKSWIKNLWAFENRLWWHCHFIQKLESEPEIEFQNVNRAFDGLRESEFNNSYFEAWKIGETGVPLVDACMRSLLQTGWLNFRMRAMLMSFSSYQLWLHWQKPAEYLAKHFLDFEAGIHFSQAQMQSGVTGINAIRIYSPEKQTQDQKSVGAFIKRYIPELQNIPDEYLADLESIPPLFQIEHGFKLGRDYPYPIVNLKESYLKARERIFNFKRKDEVKKEAQKVLIKHASRKQAQGRFPKQKREG